LQLQIHLVPLPLGCDLEAATLRANTAEHSLTAAAAAAAAAAEEAARCGAAEAAAKKGWEEAEAVANDTALLDAEVRGLHSCRIQL
jgi:hypothetical protein